MYFMWILICLLLASLSTAAGRCGCSRRRFNARLFAGWRRGTACPTAASSSRSTTTAGRRQRVGDQLWRGTSVVPAHGDQNELASLVEIGHRDSGLHSGHRDLCNVFTGLFI